MRDLGSGFEETRTLGVTEKSSAQGGRTQSSAALEDDASGDSPCRSLRFARGLAGFGRRISHG
jgi:hypothetical protein